MPKDKTSKSHGKSQKSKESKRSSTSKSRPAPVDTESETQGEDSKTMPSIKKQGSRIVLMGKVLNHSRSLFPDEVDTFQSVVAAAAAAVVPVPPAPVATPVVVVTQPSVTPVKVEPVASVAPAPQQPLVAIQEEPTKTVTLTKPPLPPLPVQKSTPPPATTEDVKTATLVEEEKDVKTEQIAGDQQTISLVDGRPLGGRLVPYPSDSQKQGVHWEANAQPPGVVVRANPGFVDFVCPHPDCHLAVCMPENAVDCGIARHGALDLLGTQPVNPHASKAEIEQLKKENKLFGCGGPLRLRRDETTQQEIMEVCDWI